MAACARSDLTLMQAQEPKQALKELETSLRYRSFAGAAWVADRADRVHARSYYEKLVSLAGNADTARPDLIAAMQY